MGPEQFPPLPGKQFDQPPFSGQFGQQPLGGQFGQPQMGGQSFTGQFDQPQMGSQLGGQPPLGGEQFEQPQMGGQPPLGGGQFEQPQMGGQQFTGGSLGEQQSTGGLPSTREPLKTAPLQTAPLQTAPWQQEDITLKLPSGEEFSYKLPSGGPTSIPGARVKEWTVVQNVPADINVPPGFKVMQYERDIEVDLANLSLAPVSTIYPCTTVCPTTTDICTPLVCEPCKPEIRVETTTIPPTQLETKTKEFPGGEEVISRGPHGEEIKTTVTQLPGGGERIETKVKEPLTTGITQREDIKTMTTIKECGPFGGTTTVESHSHLVPPSTATQYTTQGLHPGHHHASDLEQGAARKAKHEHGLLGSLKGAFSRKHGEIIPPKETQ